MGKSVRNRPQGKGELNYREKLFCLKYVTSTDFNGTQAAKEAGYAKKSAEVTASRLLLKANLKAEIDRLFEERAARQLITAEMILLELLSIARIDPNEAYDKNGDIKDIKDMPIALRKCISSIEIEVDKDRTTKKSIGYTKKLRFWNKNDALNTLARHLRLIDRLPGEGVVNQTTIIYNIKQMLDDAYRLTGNNNSGLSRITEPMATTT